LALDEVAATSFPASTTHLYGFDVAVAGDLTGDGAGDIVITGVDETVVPIASTLIFAGPTPGLAPTSAAFARILEDEDGRGAYSVGQCGDMNLDGREDLCLGTQLPIGGTTSEVPIFYGPLAGGDISLDAASVVLFAPASELIGQNLVGGADLDGDGAMDLVVGAPQRNNDEGGVYRVSDPGAGSVSIDGFPLWVGEPGAGQAGQGLAVGGDLDGDGLSDIFVGAPQFDERAGRAYILTDKEGGTLADAHFRIEADQPSDWMGMDGVVADMDGDGAADLGLGAPRDWYFALDRPGRVAVFLGPVGRGTTSFAEADLVFSGSNQPDAFGAHLDTVDLMAELAPALVVGAPFDGSNGSAAGAVYVYEPGVLSF
jgi:hypothetical protein